MRHTITTSADGSSTLKLTEFNELYHSSNGAFNEANHIYIKNGIEALYNKIATENLPQIIVYDIGLGTALNTILTLLWQMQLPNPPKIKYIGIEKYPIPLNEIEELNYPQFIAEEQDKLANNIFTYHQINTLYKEIHSSPWNTTVEITPNFTLIKVLEDIANYLPHIANNCKSVIYYDTFSPATQPHLWDKAIFKKFYKAIEKESILVTYCSKGTVKQLLREVGFNVKRLDGPIGKRHIIQATKL